MRMFPTESRPAIVSLRIGMMSLALGALAGCSSTGSLFGDDKIDYRSQAGKTAPLDVPPDLTQLARDPRYLPQSGVISASTMRQPGAAAGPAAQATPSVAPATVGELRLVREGNQRWLASPLPPEQLFPRLRSFWTDSGFVLAVDNAELGLLETDWAENRAKLPQDIVRRTIGRVLESFYSTGERDRFRTRIERTAAGGSEIYLTHKGLEEVYENNTLRERTVWQPRPRDPELEAEFLARMMVRLGQKEDAARQAVAAAPVVAGRSGAGAATPGRGAAAPAQATMTLNEGFDRAWRQVGLALDRSGFTVEDRDRSAGVYFVRYVDPKLAGNEDPNIFQRLFSGERETRPVRYRVMVKAAGTGTAVSIQNSQGEADNGEAARAIIGRLSEELR